MCKLCLGAVLIFNPIFSFSATLPSGYTQLEYIQSNDNHPRIEVDSIKNIAENEIEFQTQIMWVGSSVNNGATLNIGFGNADTNTVRTFGVAYDGYWKTANNKITPNKQASINVLYDISYKMYSNKVILEVKNGDTTEVNSTVNYNIPFDGNSIFYPTDYIGYGLRSARIYFSKVYRDGVLVFNGMPAKRNSDNAVGLYDTISNTFYKQIASQSGSGYNFIAGPVVETYTELEYLELQGEAYFNTNVYLSKDMDIEYELMPIQLGASGSLMGARSISDPGTGVTFFYNGLSVRPDLNTLIDFFGAGYSGRWEVKNGSSYYVLEDNKRYKITIINKEGIFYKDGVVLDTHTYAADGTSPITVPFYIHACNNAGSLTASNDTIRFYHFSASGAADIVPAQRDSDGELGLYNKTTGEFLEKIGSGTLVAGPAVDNPGVSEPSCEYTRLEYLKSSNTQYIQDDSFQTIGTGAIEIKTKDLQTYTRFAGWDSLIALATPNSSTNYFPFLYGSWDDYNPNPVSIAAENALRYEFEPGLQKLYVNGVFNRQAQKNTSISSAPFRIFIVSTGGGYNHGSTIYYCRVYDGNNVLLRNYVPVKRNSDNVLGMYDTVTGTFFTNKGSGTFTAGPEIVSGDICSTTITIHWDGLSEPDASGMCTYGETFTAPSTAPTAPSGLKFLGWIPR